MKKLISLLLVVVCLFSNACIVVAEEQKDESAFDQETFEAFVECFEAFCKEYFAEKTEEESVDVEKMNEEIVTLPPDEAYLAYAKNCVLLISAAANDGYDIITSIYEYSPEDVAKAFVVAEDLYAIDVSGIKRNKDGSQYDDLVTARNGYHSLKANVALLGLVLQNPIEVPEKYTFIDGCINKAYEKLIELDTLMTNFCNGTDTRHAMDVWGDAETLYWDESILALRAIFYVDTMCD